MPITVKWNQNYDEYCIGYNIEWSTTRNGTYTSLVDDLPKTTTIYFDAAGVPCNWYRITPLFSREGTPWEGTSSSLQYYSESIIAEPKLQVYQEIVPDGAIVDITVGLGIPGAVTSLYISPLSNASATGTLVAADVTMNSDGFASIKVTLPALSSDTYVIKYGDVLVSDEPIEYAEGVLGDVIHVSTKEYELVEVFETDILSEFQSIKVHNEGTVENNLGNTLYKFAFPRWNLAVKPQFFMHGTDIISNDYYLDNDTGMVGIVGVERNADIYCNYAFKYFSQIELLNYMRQACNELNLIKPYTEYSVGGMPSTWEPLIMIGAYRWALRSILQSMMFRDMRLATVGDGAVTIIQALLNEATTSWQNVRKDAKRRGMIEPGVITSGKSRVPMRVSGVNWKDYAGVI